jgi:phosphatidate phosphatase APP1
MDGATFRQVVDQDGIEAYIRKYWELAVTQRNAHFIISDIEDTVSISKIAS